MLAILAGGEIINFPALTGQTQMSRHKNPIPVSRLEVAIPQHLRLQAELFLQRDFITGKVKLGAWSEYIIRLISNDLQKETKDESE